MAARRRLYVLRHAKSSWDEPPIPDIERPLNRRGRRAGKLIADHLRAGGVTPQAVIRSPAVRTEQTFELIAEGLPENTTTWSEPRAYAASADVLLELLRELPPELGSAMLIGHNPGAQELVLALAGSGEREPLARLRRKFPTAALATLSFEGEWVDLRAGGARLEALVRPKQLG